MRLGTVPFPPKRRAAWSIILIAGIVMFAATAAAQPYRFATRIVNPSPSLGDQFGDSLAILDTAVLVGAPFEDATGSDAGMAYLFDGVTGALLQTFVNPQPNGGHYFAESVAGKGSYVIVGSRNDDTAGGGPPYTGNLNTGAAYVFDRATGEVVRALLPPEPNTAGFGRTVAMLGDNVLVSASNSGGTGPEKVYLFDPATGQLLQSFNNPNSSAGHVDAFGAAVWGVNETLLIGAHNDESDGSEAVGIAYLFDPANGALLHTLHNPTILTQDRFGWSLAIAGTIAFVGAPNDDTGAMNAGAVYPFDTETGASLGTVLSPTSPSEEYFGSAITAARDYFMVGAPLSDDKAQDGGAVYVFNASSRAHIRTIYSPIPENAEYFGSQLAAQGPLLAIAANANDAGAENSGVVYVFTTCGDGTLDADEECDDSNLTACDGCSATCTLEFVAPTPTATPTPTGTPTVTATVTPEAPLPIFGKATRQCAKALASKSAGFAVKLRNKLQQCLDTLLRDLAAGKDTSRTAESCAAALDLTAPTSQASKARAAAQAAIVAHCAGITPSDMHNPCGSAASLGELTECVLAEQQASAERMIGPAYADACQVLGLTGLHAQFPTLCPP